MSILVPKLPEGDYWEVEKDDYPEKGRTVTFKWWSRAPYNHIHTVAHVSVKPKHARYGFLLCWLLGKRRIAQDEAFERQKQRTEYAVKFSRESAWRTGQTKP